MKKLFFALGIVLVLLACGDKTDYSKLPATDINNFTAENTITFPVGTTALQIYDTVVSLSPNDSTLTISNGKIVENNEIKNFNKIKYEHTFNTWHYYNVYFYNGSTSIFNCSTTWDYVNGDRITASSLVINSEISFQY
jgi:hypothetical protein